MSQIPEPTEQHERLARKVGTWNVACRFFMDPTQEPMEVRGTDRAVMHGRFFLQSTFEADMFGAPLTGITTLGYSPATGKYQATWADTFSPHLFYFEGGYNDEGDDEGKVLTLTTEAPMPGGGALTKWRSVETSRGPDEHLFEMFVEVPMLGEMKILEHTYTRES